MNFLNLCRERFSCRAYTSQPVPAELLDTVMQCVHLAPSACNRQPWRFVVVTDAAERAAIAATYSRPFVAQAPVIIVALGVHDQAWHRGPDGKDHTDVDVAIAVEHLCLAATAAGLATCWVCNFDPMALRQVMHLEDPDAPEPIAIIPLGYADTAVPDKHRKPIDEIVKWGIQEKY